MNQPFPPLFLGAAGLAIALMLSGCTPPTGTPPVPAGSGKSPVTNPSAPAAPERTVSFTRDVKPILREKCVHCHNQETLEGRVSFESRELALQGGAAGPVIIPGSPEKSLLYHNVVTERAQFNAMPPVGHEVTPEEKKIFYTWIKEGAEWPAGSAGRIRPRFRPLE